LRLVDPKRAEYLEEVQMWAPMADKEMLAKIAKVAEATRTRYRPKRIMTLFVGESAPASGTFFYYGNNAMSGHMQRAVESALGESGNFLESFKAYGWYLDDLVSTPVDHLTKSQRKAKCLDAQKSLADRIRCYQPEAIVSLLIGIKPFVEAVAIAAGSNAPRYAAPFPGHGCTGRKPAFVPNAGAALMA
jgi:hypothetical protein